MKTRILLIAATAIFTPATVQAQEPGFLEAAPAERKAQVHSPLVEDETGKPAKVPWSPDQAAGAPDTPEAGDYSTAWAAAIPDHQVEWLQLQYMTVVEVSAVRLYESYNPGAISKVAAIQEDGKSVELTRNADSKGKWTAEFKPPAGVRPQARVIRVEINEPLVAGWNEIDAVGLLGADESFQWASSATASSSFGSAGRTTLHLETLEVEALAPEGAVAWGANQATGAPNTLRSGDFSTAWASLNPDGGEEWLEVTFATAVQASGCVVYQSYNPGAIVAVKALGEDGATVATLDSKSATERIDDNGIGILRWTIEGAPKVKKVRIELDTRLVQGWNEIDAVQLTAQDGTTQWADSATASSSYGAMRGGGVSGPGGAIPGLSVAGSGGIYELQSRVDRLSTGMKRLSDYNSPELALRGNFVVADKARRKGLPWSAEQATGEPDTPQRGDIPSAWAPREIASGEEWLEVSFPKGGLLASLRVYESNLPGAITGVKALLPNGNWMSLATAANEVAPHEPRIVTATPANGLPVPAAQTFRIELDTRKTPDGWPEIDAVEFLSADGTRQWASKAAASSSYSDRYQPQPAKAAAFQRANSLEEANQRIEQLNQRLETLERQIRELSPGTPPVPESNFRNQ